MGLDITAYEEIKKVSNDFDEEGNLANLYVNAEFAEHAEGVDDGSYEYKKEMGFRAGSYSGYNQWRNMLSVLAGYEDAADCWSNNIEGAFYELINFSDCEGVINSKVSKKLANDFGEYQGKADEHKEDWFKQKYSEWRLAFSMASNNGAVSFH